MISLSYAKDWLIALRPVHWVKSGFCLAALFFAGHADDLHAWLQVLPCLVGFGLLASAGYVLNDVWNVQEDRHHPRKRLRPITSGRISTSVAWGTGVGLALAGLAVLYLAYGVTGGAFLMAFWCGLFYLIQTLLYSLVFRSLPFVDVLVLGMGFVFRVAGGAFALGLSPTWWLLSCTYALALCLGYGKRQGEWQVLEQRGGRVGETRASLRGYTRSLLDVLVAFFAMLAAGLYVAYCLRRPDRMPFLLTGVPVVSGLMLYVRIAWRSGLAESPEHLFVRSPGILTSVLAWALSIVILGGNLFS